MSATPDEVILNVMLDAWARTLSPDMDAVARLKTALTASGYAIVPQPKPIGRTVPVRIAVAMVPSGAWGGCGWDGANDKDAVDGAIESALKGKKHEGISPIVSFITADLPVPEVAEIAGQCGEGMTYAEKLARRHYEWPDDEPVPESMILITDEWLATIAATGCKVVAREPTREMVAAWDASDNDGWGGNDWHAMFDAAPSVPGDDA